MKKLILICIVSSNLIIKLCAQRDTAFKFRPVDTTVVIKDIKIGEHPRLVTLQKDNKALDIKVDKLIDTLLYISKNRNYDNEFRRGAIWELEKYLHERKVIDFLLENISLNLNLPADRDGNAEDFILEFPCYYVLEKSDVWILIPYLFDSFNNRIYQDWDYHFRFSLLEKIDKKVLKEICNYYLKSANENGKININKFISEIK